MPLSSITVITDWVAITTQTGSWNTNTSYDGTYARVNDTMHARLAILLSGAPNSTALSIDPPNGETVDESKLPTIGAGSFYPVGNFIVWDDSVSTIRGGGQILYNNSSNELDFYITTTAPNTSTAVNELTPITFASNDYISAEFSIPISGW